MNWTWFKPAAWGAVLGALATMIIGFGWGGWATTGTLNRIEVERTAAAVTAALVPVCLEKSKADPALARKLGELKALPSSYEQREVLLKSGWATVGTGEANREVADACVAQLLNVAAK